MAASGHLGRPTQRLRLAVNAEHAAAVCGCSVWHAMCGMQCAAATSPVFESMLVQPPCPSQASKSNQDGGVLAPNEQQGRMCGAATAAWLVQVT
mmetsp:Transcript_1557/g.4172  ORF Transcript_1557/g.4172 Transcript_1557/m.4172 type:complete len:94 (-) Transcript_1557:774-1055(-)